MPSNGTIPHHFQSQMIHSLNRGSYAGTVKSKTQSLENAYMLPKPAGAILQSSGQAKKMDSAAAGEHSHNQRPAGGHTIPFITYNRHLSASRQSLDASSVTSNITNNDGFRQPQSVVRFDFIESFTTTFLRAHSWLNWVAKVSSGNIVVRRTSGNALYRDLAQLAVSAVLLNHGAMSLYIVWHSRQQLI